MAFQYAAQLDDTIAALASAPGLAARGIVRISGPNVLSTVAGLFVPAQFSVSHAARYAGEIRLSTLRSPLPTDLYLWPTRRSFSGQPLAELHTIGSPPLLEAILVDLFAGGVRAAQPGEFTLRAFLAGQLDLTQAEAVLGVIDARDDRELQTALNQMAGGLSTQILQLRRDLLDLLADLEAGLDFADEAIEFVSYASLIGRLGLARDAVANLLARADQRMRPSSRPRVVLAGPPNAGKSTLFNALIGSSRALVSAEAGTTRDYLRAETNLAGLDVELIDTAGRDASSGPINRQARKFAQEQAECANLLVWCQAADQSVSASLPDAAIGGTANLLAIVTKGDLVNSPLSSAPVVCAQTGDGLRELATEIAARLAGTRGNEASLLGTTAARSSESLKRAQTALHRALAIARNESDQELLAIEVREALDELGKIAGTVYTDDILDRIFSKFCIGK